MSYELNKGFAIIIDDQLGNGDSDSINTIVTILENAGIPYCGYKTLEQARKALPNFGGISFLILDWRLYKHEGATIDSAQITEANAQNNIKLLREFKEVSFAPVFILSAENKQDIEAEFEEYGKDLLNKEENRNFIMIKNKADLTKDDALFNEIKTWTEDNPAVYTIKVWQNAFIKAKNQTFWNLFAHSPIWPKILWDASEKDGVIKVSDFMKQ